MNRNNIDVKVNWNRNDKNQIWAKYSIMKALVTCGFSLGEAGGPGSCTGGGLGEGKTLVQVATIGTSYTVSPTFLIDATFGWTRFGQQVDPPDLGTNFGSDVLGIPGTNGPDPRESGMPAFYISGYTNLGNAEGWNPLQRNDQSYTFNLNFNKIKGNHDIRFGLDLMHHLMNHWQPELGEGPRGAFDFAPGTTALNPDALDATVGFQDGTPSFENDWNGVASFLLGVSDYTGKSSQYIKMTSLENTWALYIRDRWRVTPKLTLNLGLRWELYPTRTRAQNMGIESYDAGHQRRPGRRVAWSPPGQRRGLQQEALCSPFRVRLSGVQQHGHTRRLRYHLPLASLGRSGLAWFLSAHDCRDLFGYSLPIHLHGSQLRSGGYPERTSGPRCRYSADLLPRPEPGQAAAAAVGHHGLPRGQQGDETGIHPIVEPHRRA